MTFREFKQRFISVRKCVACREILDYDRAEHALCERCELRINPSMLRECEKCFRSARECTCMPSVLSRMGVLCHRKLFFYTSEGKRSIENRLIYTLKNIKSSRLQKYFAKNLAKAVEEELLVIGGDNVIITYVPRNKQAYTAFGFDQSRELVKYMSEILGIPYRQIFETKARAKIQKKLTAAERLRNAENNIRAVKGADVEGKYAVLVDDIVTTGASMRACTAILLSLGAKGVLCFSVASKNKM